MRQPCTNGRFDEPHRSIRGGCWKSALGRSYKISTCCKCSSRDQFGLKPGFRRKLDERPVWAESDLAMVWKAL